MRTYEEDSQGNVTLHGLGKMSAFLQGDDADIFMREVWKMDEIWEQVDFVGPIGPFLSYEQHLDAVIDQYDCIMEPVSCNAK